MLTSVRLFDAARNKLCQYPARFQCYCAYIAAFSHALQPSPGVARRILLFYIQASPPLLRSCKATAIRMQTLPTDHTAIGTRQKHKRGSDLAWLSRSPHGRGKLLLCVFVHRGWNEWCPYGTWADGVHADTFADLLVCQTAGKRDDSCESMLGRAYNAGLEHD